MIVSNLHRQPTALDTVLHRDLRLDNTLSAVHLLAPFTSFMICLSEFGDASRDFPILFVRAAPENGKDTIAPVVVFGLKPGENLFLVDGAWQASYVPAMLRAYPFTMARIEDSDRWAMVFDNGWQGVNRTQGERLFDDQGEATPFLNNAHRFVQELESDMERTRQFCAMLLELNILKPMRFDATYGDGQQLSVDGFMTINPEAMAALPDAKLAELYRNGSMHVLVTHQMSLNNMRRLVDRRVTLEQRPAAAPAAA